MNFVTVATFNLAHQAHLVKGKLESEGIPCIITDEHTITMNWFYSYALGGIKVKVLEINYQKALRILKDDFSEELKDVDVNDDSEPASNYICDINDLHESEVACPYCHSLDIILTCQEYPKTLLNKLTLGVIKPKPIKRYHCIICLNNWSI